MMLVIVYRPGCTSDINRQPNTYVHIHVCMYISRTYYVGYDYILHRGFCTETAGVSVNWWFFKGSYKPPLKRFGVSTRLINIRTNMIPCMTVSTNLGHVLGSLHQGSCFIGSILGAPEVWKLPYGSSCRISSGPGRRPL